MVRTCTRIRVLLAQQRKRGYAVVRVSRVILVWRPVRIRARSDQVLKGTSVEHPLTVVQRIMFQTVLCQAWDMLCCPYQPTYKVHLHTLPFGGQH